MVSEILGEAVRFGEGAYGVRWANYTAVFFVTGDGVIVVDPCGQSNPRLPHMLKAAIGSVTEAPVKYVVYSHWGADHGMGASIFADTAQFVGHKNSVARIESATEPNSPVPGIVIDKPYSIELGGTKLDLYPADIADNDDYLIIHHPATRLAMFVDLVQPRSLPFRAILGHPDRIVERLAWLESSLDFEVLLSGHATPTMTCTKQDVSATRRYYLDLSDAIEAARLAGKADASPEMVETVSASLRPIYGDWRRFEEFIAANVEGMIGWRAGKNLRTT